MVTAEAYGAAPGPAPDVEPRCHHCASMLARVVSRPWVIDCKRCKARNQAGLPLGKTAEDYGATPRRSRPGPARRATPVP